MSAIFTHDDEQLRLAEETARDAAERRGRPVTTEIAPLQSFTLAEDYHQKYRLRRLKTVAAELEAIYPELDDFVRSTAATRINAFAAGYGRPGELEATAPKLGLGEAALDELRRAAK